MYVEISCFDDGSVIKKPEEDVSHHMNYLKTNEIVVYETHVGSPLYYQPIAKVGCK